MDKDKEFAVAYLRYSSHAQDRGNSIEAQLTCINNYASAHNIKIEKYYTDVAKSGRYTYNRHQYLQMKADFESGELKSKTIISRALDRYHRHTSNQLLDLDWIEDNGIRLIAINDSIDTASPGYNKFAAAVVAAMAEETSNNISKNTRAALLECAKQGRHLGGIPLIGYKVNDVGLYEIDELTAPIIRDIFNLYASGMGYSYIKKHLKSRGYKTTNGNDFSDTAIHSILTNKKFKGTYTYDRTASKDSDGRRNSHKEKPEYVVIPDGMPAIIEPELFDKVQEKMAENASKQTHRTGKNYYALNGFLQCPECGKAFSGNVNNSNGHKYLQYKKSCDCDLKSVRADHLNKFVFHAVKNCIFSPQNKQKIMDAVNQKLSLQKHIQCGETNAIQNKINGLEKANSNLMKYLEKGKATDTILSEIDKNEKIIKQLKIQLDSKSNEISEIDDKAYECLVKKFNNYMCTVKSPESAALKAALIDNIQIGKENITVDFKPGVTIDENTKDYFNAG